MKKEDEKKSESGWTDLFVLDEGDKLVEKERASKSKQVRGELEEAQRIVVQTKRSIEGHEEKETRSVLSSLLLGVVWTAVVTGLGQVILSCGA